MLVLIRHPETALPPGVCYGRRDVPLARDSDIAGIVVRLSSLPAFSLWSSPAVRCAAVARGFGLEIRFDGRLRELDFGAWEGRPWSDVPRAALDDWAAHPDSFTPPGGEGMASLVARVTAFHADLRRLPGPHVVVSHGGPLRVLGALARGRAVDLLAASPSLGSVQFFTGWRSHPDAGGDAQHDALGGDFRGAENVAGAAADLPPRQHSDRKRRGGRADDAG